MSVQDTGLAKDSEKFKIVPMQRLSPAVGLARRQCARAFLLVPILLVVTAALSVAEGAKKSGGGGAGHARSSGGGSKSGGGASRQGNAMHGNNAGNFAKHSQGLGNQSHQGKGTGHFKGFATKTTHGQMSAFHSSVGKMGALHSHSISAVSKVQAFHVQKFSTVAQNYHSVVHDRVWWTTHYNRVVFIGGGWYYWDAGYWYPALGYDPTVTYVYDGPIYTYDNLPPDEVIMNVQSELEFLGYCHGAIDGQLGPQTRAAIAQFQQDHELEVTSAVDEPTVNLLGLA